MKANFNGSIHRGIFEPCANHPVVPLRREWRGLGMEVRVGVSILATHSPSFQAPRASRNEVERRVGVDRCVNHEAVL